MSRDRTARTRIRQYLASSGPVVDPSGHATQVLKDAIGYQGSSVAFIQLIAAMHRDGELERDIRGKRTHRIAGVGAPPNATVVPSGPSAQARSAAATSHVSDQSTIELDYTKLARALVGEFLAAAATSTEVATAAGSSGEKDELATEREEYARRLALARRHLDELLGEPLAASVIDGPPRDDAANGSSGNRRAARRGR